MPKIPALPYVRSGVSEGISATVAYNRMLQTARQASFQMGDKYTTVRQTVFNQMYSETRLARSRIADALTAPKNVPGGGLKPEPRSTRYATGYGHWASIFHRPVGGTEVERFYYLASSHELLTPAEVEARARADFEEAAQQEHGTVTNRVIEGVIFTGVEQYNPSEGT